MKVIRKGVFETNSSSSHSISISGEDDYYPKANDAENIKIYYGEFGWEYKKLNTVYDKLSYIITMIEECYEDYYLEWLKELIEEYLGCDLKVVNLDGFYEKGYIDHQSHHILDEYFVNNKDKFKEKIKELIFNNKYSIITDNDNSPGGY